MGIFKTIFFSGILFFSAFSAIAQDENTLDVYIIRNITPENRVESYMEIRDSVFAVMEYLNEKWGESKNDFDKVFWNNVKIDSIKGTVKVTMVYGISKGENAPFKVCPIPKKEKSNNKHVLRFRFIQKDTDLLSASDTEAILKNYFQDILKEIASGENGANGKEDNE